MGDDGICRDSPWVDNALYDVTGLTSFCPEVFDGTLCWPDTPPGLTATLSCPAHIPRVNPHGKARRFCDKNGTWGSYEYGDCITEEVHGTEPSLETLEEYWRIINGAKLLELVGLILSLIAVVVALYIFHSFRSLRNPRTRIHRNLFFAFLIRMIIDFIFIINRFRQISLESHQFVGIKTIAPLMNTVILGYEYMRLCTFAWFFVEGVYLNSLLSTAVFRKPNFLWYYLIGWVAPIPFSLAFCVAMRVINKRGNLWNYYSDQLSYVLLIEVPRNVFLVMNLFLLLNIIRVLVTKLRESQTSETKQVRKAAKACIVLLPLLGIVNLVWVLKNPELGDPTAYIAVYNYGCLFLDAFQGFILALLYCFLNIDVRVTIKRKWMGWINARNPYRAHGSVVTTTTDSVF